MPKASRALLALILLFAVLLSPLAASEPIEPVHHDLKVEILPGAHRIEGTDVITFPEGFLSGKRTIPFRIHKGMDVACLTDGVKLIGVEGDGTGSPHMVSWHLRAAGDAALPGTVTLSLKGAIHHPVKQTGKEYARSFSETPGIICDEGVFLSTGSGWYPAIAGVMVSFDLAIGLPGGWDAVSQGVRAAHDRSGEGTRVVWSCPHPQDDIYITAGKYFEYSSTFDTITAYAFLRSDDPSLAAKYLEATEKYITLYTDLIGPYPYRKFALVENFWETGYGMPSFTLLGPQVIRFPFILTSSYPHEILHNWWGNGVFVAPGKGNWCEGLTAYLADHLIKEQQGRGAEHRRGVLQKYADYVQSSEDLPLAEFRSRHNAESEAIGYGKCLMLFHQLRLKVGDETFIAGLREFFSANLFRPATFDDVAAAFSKASGRDLSAFVDQWVVNPGAVRIGIFDGGTYPVSGDPEKYHVDFIFDQRQEPLFDCLVPIAIFVEGQEEAVLFNIETRFKRSQAAVDVPGRPLRIEVDPRFELFRRLEPEEIPPSIGRVFGSDRVAIVLPAAAQGAIKEAWEKLAALWSKGSEGITVCTDDTLDELPDDASVWVIGRLNRFSPANEPSLHKHDVAFTETGLRVGENSHPFDDRSLTVTYAHPRNPAHVVCWVHASCPEAIAGLGRKLPHYGKYSWLVFEGSEPTNIGKGQWPILNNPLARNFDKKGAPGKKVPARKALAEPRALFTDGEMMKHVLFLADDRLTGRGLGTPELDEAAAYIAEAFESAGLAPAGDEPTAGGGATSGAGSAFFQEWTDADVPGGQPATLKNVIGRIAGADPALSAVVVGAHYDHLGVGWPDVRAGNEGKIHPGADDNASGVAALIEVARVLAKTHKPKRTILFVAFTGEEAGLRGSRRFVEQLGPEPAKKVFAMINLDSVGRLGARRLQILGTGSAKEWPHIVMGVGYTTGVEADSIVRDSGGGDQVSFLTAGIPAVHVFAGMHEDYHAPGDSADKVDAAGIVKAALLVREATVYLSDRADPLTVTLANAVSGGKPPERPAGTRRVSLGTMPDFAFKGEGVKVGAVMPGSAAEAAGLLKGDVIRKIDGKEVKDLRAFAALLKDYAPGDRVTVHFLRDGAEKTVEAVLRER